MGDNSSESFYSGSPSSLSPDNGNFIGYRMDSSGLASTTSPMTANQLGEVVSRIKEGVKNIELQPLTGAGGSSEVFEQIPKQHFDEMRALMKLSGVKPSLHAPILSPAGFGQRGFEGETVRQDTERKFLSVVERAQQLDPKGNVPIVFHSTEGIPGNEYVPGDENKGEERFKAKKVLLINQEKPEGFVPLDDEKTFYASHPEDFKDGGTIKQLDGKKKIKTIDGKTIEVDNLHKEIMAINATQWDNTITQLATTKKQADDLLRNLPSVNGALDSFKNLGSEISEDDLVKKLDENPSAWGGLKKVQLFLDNNERSFNSAFHQAYKYGNEQQKQELRKQVKEWNSQEEKIRNIQNPLESVHAESDLLDKKIAILGKLTSGRAIMGDELIALAPQVITKAEDFILEKSAKTFGNVAWKGYEKFKENTPLIAIENMYTGMAMQKPEDFERLIKESRNVFVENAIKNGMNKGDAKKKAEKFIGATWDVGHLNLMKKSGFKDTDLIKATKRLAPYVKHIHLTDNFGYSDSHLAPGMGNVPIKGILKELEKTGRLGEMRKVVEAGALVIPNSGLGMSPLKATLEAFGSPIYGMQNDTYWNQAMNTVGGYFSGYGDMNPQIHHSIYGSGFTTLPKDLGGNIPGGASRLSGTPNA